MPVDLSRFNNSWYSPGRPYAVQALWFFFGLPLLRAGWNPSSALRRGLLRLFGASIGRGVVIKPGVRVKYPWLLKVGDHAWIGENAWIDNLTTVTVGAHVCISQGAYLCTGNHDWSDPAFGLIVKPITLRAGAWVGAQSVICPNTTLEEGAIVTAGSVAAGTLRAMGIYTGNPAVKLRDRVMRPVKAGSTRPAPPPT